MIVFISFKIFSWFVLQIFKIVIFALWIDKIYVQTHTLVGIQNAVCEILVPDHFKIPKACRGKNGSKMGQIFKKMILPKMSNLMIKIDYCKDKTLYLYK